MDNFVVTFARGFGTGGKAIASQLAKELGIHCYENRILTLASQLSGLDENVFQEVNEKLREEGGFTSFLRGLPRAKGYISRNEKFRSDDRLFEYQSQIINELADKETFQKILEIERMKEFLHEGQRYFDVRRWGIYEETENETIMGMNVDGSKENFYQRTVPNTSRIGARLVHKKLYLLPIPLSEIRKLPSCDQNPDWES